MNKKALICAITLFVVVVSLGASSKDYYLNRFQIKSDSGSVTCYNDHFHLGGGSKLYLTVQGAGQLTFRANGYEDWFWCRCDGNLVWTCKSHYGYVDVSVNISGDGLHTIVWNTYSSWASSGWGDVASVTWDGKQIPLNLGPYETEVPTITPDSGTTFDTDLSVTITGDEDVAIYYTIDGSEPTIESTPYKRFRIYGKTTVKAIAVAEGLEPSDVAVAHYALGTCTNPVISLEDGSVFQHSNQEVSIDWVETDGILRYTLDGSEPTNDSTEYVGPFTISNTTTVRAKVFSDKFFDSDVASATLTREWVKVTTPTVALAASFTGTKTKATFACSTKGATIHYTLDGSTPNDNSPIYTGPLFITEACTVKAYAVLNDYIDSEVASATVERVWGVGDSIGVPDMRFKDGGNVPWARDAVTYKGGADSMRSGSIENEQTSELFATVKGKGTLSFWWKASCEDSDGVYDWDHAEFHADDQVYYLEGETDWIQLTHNFSTDGEHTLRWVYRKDDAGKDGNDCVWIDELEWVGDPIPDLGGEPVVDEIEDVLYEATDGRLIRHITDGGKYKAFHQWADRACGSDFVKRQGLKESSNAWLSFALDSDTLIVNTPKQGDLTIDDFKSSETSSDAFDFELSVEGIAIGDGATADNLAEVFGVEGATTLNGEFSADNVELSFETPIEGKVKCTARPKDATATSFFMKANMNP